MKQLLRVILPFTVCLTAVAAAEEPVSFSRQIRGILSDRCFQCHGPDEAHREAGLRLDEHDAALAELDSGTRAIVPGDADASELIARVISDDPDLRMPPASSGKQVSAAEAQLLKDWINQGAGWGQHWAFEAVVRPESPLPDDDSRLPVDHFVAARLQREGLEPSPAADRVTQLRRVTLDLTGLPPTPEEVDVFLADESGQAYEAAVDRLLQSPRYGEHMARYWLDVARYGDTHGLHLDNFREMWAYRDWVVDAFNSNKPYDVFITEQLAGDLLPDPTEDQLIATGFNRCNVTTSEGGSIEEEVHVRNVVDRVVTTGTAFMALTMDCSRCHDHKFDPLTMKDFYSFYAFFNSIDGKPLDGNRKDHAPVMKVLTDDQQQQVTELKQRLANLNGQIDELVAAADYSEPEQPEVRTLSEPQDYVWIEDGIPEGVTTSNQPWKFAGEPQPVYSGSLSNELVASGLKQNVFDKAPEPLVVAEGDTLFCYVYPDPKNPPKEIMLQFFSGSWEHRVYWGENLIPWGQDNTPSRHHAGALPAAGEWTRLEVSVADVGLAPGSTITGWACTQQDGRAFWDHGGIRGMTNRSPWYESLTAWLADVQSGGNARLPEPLKAIAGKPLAERSDDDQQQLQRHFLKTAWTGLRESLAPVQDESREAAQQIQSLQDQAGTTLIYREKSEPKSAYMLTRGEYDQKGEEVSREVPAVLPAMPQDAPRNRLGLAQWLTSPEHPLTARVTMNRLWQQFFGIGLVKTSEDFGSQGEPPSHPLLLDWLSAELISPEQPGAQHAWDIKHLVRQIVLSQTYRQSAMVRPELLERDPENRLLARGPRFRLDAETLRDQALYVSGLLYEKQGGPSVKPPQPKGLWNAVGYTDSNTANFKADEGHEAVHRRTLYTFIKRTSPPPQMSTFDGPSRESCVVRRERSNSPMQALLLMNDPQYVECARALAERALREAGSAPEQRATFVLRQCLQRNPAPEEVLGLVSDAETFLAEYTADPEAAAALIAVGEADPSSDHDPAQLAAWTMVCNLVLNLDEFLNK